MVRSTFSEFNQKLSWNTKFYLLLAIVFIIANVIFYRFDNGFAISMIIALTVLLLVDTFLVFSKNHHSTWINLIRILITIIILLLILGLVQVGVS